MHPKQSCDKRLLGFLTPQDKFSKTSYIVNLYGTWYHYGLGVADQYAPLRYVVVKKILIGIV